MELDCLLGLPPWRNWLEPVLANGNLPGRLGVVRHWNDKGAWRMKFGMRVRGGWLAALIMFAAPVAAPLATVLASSPAVAQTVQTIEVQGNRRV